MGKESRLSLIESHLDIILDIMYPKRERGAEMSEHLRETPRRIAQSWADMLTPEEPTLTMFKAYGRREMVIEKDIPFRSLCAHHFLPFHGHVTIGYIPDNYIIGLSKFSRVANFVAASPQTQEKLTSEIADYLMNYSGFNPLAIGVIVRAEHMCVMLRGVEKHGVTTTTSALRGSFRDDLAQREEFLRLAIE